MPSSAPPSPEANTQRPALIEGDAMDLADTFARLALGCGLAALLLSAAIGVMMVLGADRAQRSHPERGE
jgi:hypothetical protein